MISAQDRRWIARTIREAEKSDHYFRVGATVVVAKRPSTAHNVIRNSPLVVWQAASTHAEEAALARAYSLGKGGTIYVARIGRRGSLLPSHPCSRCMPQIISSGVKRIVFFDGEVWQSYRINGDALPAMRSFSTRGRALHPVLDTSAD
jgi:tRNA(Arg) A34 adenosine deaminase TadA